jgi:hypothetical protein
MREATTTVTYTPRRVDVADALNLSVDAPPKFSR